MKQNKYQTGYNTRSLLQKEFDAVLNSVSSINSFIRGKEKIKLDVIPVNSEQSKKWISGEVLKRARVLSKPVFFELYRDADENDKTLILFYAVCKTYQLIPDFIIDTVLRKWYNLDHELSSYDFKSFIFRISEQHPELADMSEKNLSNTAAATLKILREVGILRGDKLVKREFNPRILNEIVGNGDSWFLEVLLLNETERQEIIGR
ncbi:MAG: BrxA family protein [Bacteroidales bacterium]